MHLFILRCIFSKRLLTSAELPHGPSLCPWGAIATYWLHYDCNGSTAPEKPDTDLRIYTVYIYIQGTRSLQQPDICWLIYDCLMPFWLSVKNYFMAQIWLALLLTHWKFERAKGAGVWTIYPNQDLEQISCSKSLKDHEIFNKLVKCEIFMKPFGQLWKRAQKTELKLFLNLVCKKIKWKLNKLL